MENTIPLEWKIEDKFKQKLKLNEAKLICEEAEKSYRDTIDTSVRIIDRNTSLLQLVAGILVGLVAYSIGKWEKAPEFDNTLITAISGIVYYLSLGLFFIFPNIKPSVYITPGTQPKKLFVDGIFDIPSEYRELQLYMTKITNLQQGIDLNTSKNTKRWGLYKTSLNFLFYSPIVLIAIYLLTNSLIK